MSGALLGSRPARPGVLLLGAPPPPALPDAWPPAGLTIEEKVDLLMAHIGPPRYDLLPGDWTLTELILAQLGLQEP